MSIAPIGLYFGAAYSFVKVPWPLWREQRMGVCWTRHPAFASGEGPVAAREGSYLCSSVC